MAQGFTAQEVKTPLVPSKDPKPAEEQLPPEEDVAAVPQQ